MKLDLSFEQNQQNINVPFSESGGRFSANFGETSVIHDGQSGAGQNGATFYPDVSADGTISWTNDRELPNPNPVNIKGEKGDKGDKGERGEPGQSGVYIGSGEMPDGYNVQIDPNGDDATDSLVAAVIAALPVYGGEVENV